MARVIDPDLARGAMERGAVLFFRMPPFVAALPLVLGGRPALSVRSGPAARGALVLHLHGGAHVAGGPRTHLAMMARCARLAGVEVILPDHRLAPEHPHPAALTDSLAVWDDLIARGHVPHLHALLMNAATFSAHQHLAVAEPVHAPDTVAGTWTPKEEALALHLRAQDKGRLEQEFLPAEAVHSAVRAWVDED